MSSGKKHKQLVVGIGTKLTLWGAGLTILLCAITCAALYVGMYFSLRSQIDTFLKGEIDEFLLTVHEHVGDDAGLQEALRHELGVRDRNDLGFRLIDSEGKILVSSVLDDPLEGLWSPPADWETHKPTATCETLVPPGRPQSYRACNLFIITADGRKCTAQSSYLLDDMNRSLASFRRTAAVVLFFALFVALAVGGFLSQRSLQPIRNIMQVARSIGAHDLRSRLALSGTGDEIDQLAVTLNGMLARIERQVREVQRFTADASHELRTPLAALRGHAELALTKRRSEDELRRTIEDSIGQYDRLHRIADDLLLLTRLDTGEAAIKHELFSLDAAVVDIADLYTPMAEEKELALIVERADQVVVSGDDGRMRQVIGNLVDNAIKYTPPTGRISVSLVQLNGHARIEIADNGIGIPAEDLPRVFDRFYRTDPSRSAQHAQGAGLGLSICRSIVEAHGGHIEIESPSGVGTRVSVVVPVGTKGHRAINTGQSWPGENRPS